MVEQRIKELQKEFTGKSNELASYITKLGGVFGGNNFQLSIGPFVTFYLMS